MNIRQLIPKPKRYFEINREERYFAALLYSALLQRGENLSNFLILLQSKLATGRSLLPSSLDSCELYFEYTYLRDLWSSIGSDNNLKRRVILESLRLSDSPRLQKMSVIDFNSFFGAGRVSASSNEIMCPATWALTKYSANLPDDEEFIRACNFKWSFNAKPDLVIQTQPDHAICIEAKYSSEEGTYPSSPKDKEVFSQRKIKSVSQTSLQEYMFKELLGMEVTHYYLTRDSASTRPNSISWKESFAAVSLDNLHPFVRRTLAATGILGEEGNSPHVVS